MKELIRRILFWFVPGEMVAAPGTIKFRFLDWLYGDPEPEFDVWFPDSPEQGSNRAIITKRKRGSHEKAG